MNEMNGQCWATNAQTQYIHDCSRLHVMNGQEEAVRIQTIGSGLHEVTLADHDLCQKVDDGVRRLVRIHLGEDVARIS